MGARLPLCGSHIASVFIPIYLAPSFASLPRCSESLAKTLSFQKHRHDTPSHSSSAQKSLFSTSSTVPCLVHHANEHPGPTTDPAQIIDEFNRETRVKSTHDDNNNNDDDDNYNDQDNNHSQKLDRLEYLTRCLQSHNLMTPRRYSLLLNASFKWARQYLDMNPDTSADATVYSRLIPIFQSWKSSYDTFGWRKRRHMNYELYVTVTWSLLRRQLGVNPQEPLSHDDIHSFIQMFLRKRSQTPVQRDQEYYNIISSLLLSIDWTQFIDHLSNTYPRQRPPPSSSISSSSAPLFANEYPSRLSLAIYLRQECIDRQRQEGQGSSQAQETRLNDLISQSLALYAHCIVKVRQNLALPVHQSLQTFSHHLSHRELRIAALSVLESNVPSPSFSAIVHLFKAALSCMDPELARTLYLYIRDPPTQPKNHPVSLSHSDEEEINSMPLGFLLDHFHHHHHHHETKLPSFVWDLDHIYQFRRFFHWFHQRDPKFALMLYNDWCNSSNPPRPFPDDLWIHLFVTASCRNDTLLLKQLLHHYQSQKHSKHNSNIPDPDPDVLLPPEHMETIIRTFTRSHSVVPLLRAFYLLQNIIAPYPKQKIPLHLYDIVLTHLSKAYQDRTTTMLNILDTLPHVPQTSTLNPILASIVSRFLDLNDKSFENLDRVWKLFDSSNATPDATSFSCLLFGLTRLGRLDQAYETWLDLLGRGQQQNQQQQPLVLAVRPNIVAFLIEKCVLYDDMARAQTIGKQWKEHCLDYYQSIATTTATSTKASASESDEKKSELQQVTDSNTFIIASESTDWINVIDTAIAFAHNCGPSRYVDAHDVWVIGRDILRPPV